MYRPRAERMEAPGVTSATRPSALLNARLTKALMRCTLRSHVRLRSTRAILRRWRSTSTRWICRRSSSSKSMSRTVSSVRIRRSSSEERDPCVTCDAVGSMRAADASALGGGHCASRSCHAMAEIVRCYALSRRFLATRRRCELSAWPRVVAHWPR